MSIYRRLFVCCLLGIGLSNRSLANDGAVAQRPNVILMLCDDLGFGDLSLHGHPHIQTPHLDQLAASGLHMTSFYSTAPVCSPSRVGLLTGRSPNRSGVYDWIPSRGRARPDAREQVHMLAGTPTIASVLKSAGYDTCLSGKWHCNSAFNSVDQPQPDDAGFNHWFATQNNAAPSHKNPKNFVRNGKSVGPLQGFSCQLVTDEVIQWLQQRKSNTEAPFFVYLAFHEPHEPVASPADLVAKYLPVAENEDQAQYFANVHNVDLAVGRLIKALERLNLRDNTLLIFSSDNGPETLKRYARANRSWGRTGQLRGMKLHTYDGGFHVAGIMNWPAGISHNRQITAPVSALDLLPTLAALGNAKLPTDLELDGTDISETITGQSRPQRSKPLIWAYYNAINDARVAMRHKQWKVLARLNGGRFRKLQNLTPDAKSELQKAKLDQFEIYDLRQDPRETTNLVGTGLPNEDELRRLLTSHYAQLLADSVTWSPKVKR